MTAAPAIVIILRSRYYRHQCHQHHHHHHHHHHHQRAGEVTRPRGIAWWQLSLPSMSPPVLPSSSINNSPGNRKPSMLLHSPSFFHPLLVHRSPSGGSLIRGGGGGGGGACAAHRLPSGKSLIQSEGALQVPVNRKPASHQL